MSWRVQSWLLSTIPAAVLLFVLASWRIAELVFFPVVDNFVVHSVERQFDRIIISGTLNKARACRFESVRAYGISTPNGRQALPLLFMDSRGDETATRPTGPQKWGPWRITVPATPNVVSIELKSLHSCHWLWAQQTHLADVPLIYKDDQP